MCSGQKQCSNTHRFECFVLDVWIVCLADWYLAILTTLSLKKVNSNNQTKQKTKMASAVLVFFCFFFVVFFFNLNLFMCNGKVCL